MTFNELFNINQALIRLSNIGSTIGANFKLDRLINEVVPKLQPFTESIQRVKDVAQSEGRELNETEMNELGQAGNTEVEVNLVPFALKVSDWESVRLEPLYFSVLMKAGLLVE